MAHYEPPRHPRPSSFPDAFSPTQSGDDRNSEQLRSDKWPPMPPTITTGRLKAHNTKLVPLRDDGESILQSRGGPVHVQKISTSVSLHSASEPMYRISFIGADRQWHRIQVGEVPVLPQAQPGQNLTMPKSVSLDGWGVGEVDLSVINQKSFSAQSMSGISMAGIIEEDDDDDDEEKGFFRQIVQPALEGLMDGSIASLAPIFLAAFTTHQPLTTFLIGTGAAISGGVSEFISESLSDDEELSERGNPYIRGGVTSLFTVVSGIIPALPFLIPTLHLALIIAYIAIISELLVIAIARCKFLGVKWWVSALQVLGGGLLVFVAALLLGNA